MPRSIIDTESSRAAYNRRRTRIAVILLIGFGLLATGSWFFIVHSHLHPTAHPAVPGNSAR